ncbi:unnamed protein product [Phytomonas sp. EM1]|nr:unnamed protein product [Phytomonas sp. EM1]|eukprot:CCW60719.1 unnamed protein product [Phytomonas sp. isolate EM1]
MLCTLAPSTTQIVLCTDDQAVVDTLKRVSPRLFAREVEILSTETPETIVDVDEALINDTPCIDFTLEDFAPRCGRAKVLDDAALSPLKSIPDVLASPAEERPEAVTDPKAALPHDESDLSTAKHEGVAGPDALHLWDSPWLSMLNDPLEDPVLVPTAEQEDARAEGGSSEKASSAPALSEGFTATAREGALEHGEQPPYEALMDLYASPNDVIPIGVKVREANDLGSIFGQFDVMDPDARALQEEEAKARRSRLTAEGGAHQTGKRRRRRLELEKEALNSRGASNKEKYHLARQLSNQSGGRVPFNFRYRVVEANILDPRNAPLRKSYEEALQKKREAFKNRM